MLPKTSVFKHAALRGTVEREPALIAPIEDTSIEGIPFKDNPFLGYRYAVIPYDSDLVQTEDLYIGTMDHRGRFNELQWFSLPKDAKVSVNEFRYPWDSPLAMMLNEDKDVFINNNDGFGASSKVIDVHNRDRWTRSAELEARYGLGPACPSTMTEKEMVAWDERERRGENVGQRKSK